MPRGDAGRSQTWIADVDRGIVTRLSAVRHVVFGLLVGLGVAAVAMAAASVVLALPFVPAADVQGRDAAMDRISGALRFGVVYFVLAAGPTGAALGGAAGVLVYAVRRRRRSRETRNGMEWAPSDSNRRPAD
jgi:hypothetical protein